MMRKWMTLLLALCLLLFLVACGKEQEFPDTLSEGLDQATGGSEGAGISPADEILMGRDDAVALGTPATTLDPQQIYASLTYSPEMFYGDYRLLGDNEAAKAKAKELDSFKVTVDGDEMELPILPHRLETGENTLNHWVTRIDGYHWCRASFMRKYDEGQYSLDTMLCAYTVEGNTLTLNPIDKFEVDAENNHITYSLTDAFLTYEFSFKGRELTLTKDGQSVTLSTGLSVSDDSVFIDVEAYPSGNSVLDGIERMVVGYYGNQGSVVKVSTFDDVTHSNCSGKMEANGLFTFTIPWETGAKSYQFVYFYCGEDGLVLTDGANTYNYNDGWYTYLKGDLSANVTLDGQEQLEDLSEQELEAIIEKKDHLMADLAAAFADAGIRVTVNESTGELAMDASILFGGDSAELTDAGKTFLDQFMAVYTAIISDEAYVDFVAKTLVEGHTALLDGSTYESGLPLSQERAQAVQDYCATAVPTLGQSLEAVGMSNSKPIYADDGSVDLDASRRVSFKFIINLGK